MEIYQTEKISKLIENYKYLKNITISQYSDTIKSTFLASKYKDTCGTTRWYNKKIYKNGCINLKIYIYVDS